MGNAIRRGLALLIYTRDSMPGYAKSSLNCTSCHLNGGRTPNAAPLYGVHARYPQYLDRIGAVIPIADRVNYCITRSLSGNRLPSDSREMQDILAYLAFLSRGLPVGTAPPGIGMPKMTALQADSGRGREIFAGSAPSATAPMARELRAHRRCGGRDPTASRRRWHASSGPPRLFGTTCRSTRRER